MAELLIPYALKGERIVFVDDVDRGLGCGCICPKCGQALNARKGDVREHHFAHHGEQPCRGAYEETLHRLAIQILKDNRYVMAPSYKDIIPAHQLRFKHVEKEVWGWGEGIRPDVVGTCEDDTQICVEIRCTHAVDDAKLSKIIDQGIRCMEIDIRNCPMDESKLRTFLLESTDDRKWLNHPEYERRWQEEEKKKEEERQKQEHERGQRNGFEARRMESHRSIMQPSLTDITKNEIPETKNKGRSYQEEPKIVLRPMALHLQDGPIKDYYESLHAQNIFNEYTEAETKVVNFGLSYSRSAIFVIHVNKIYKGVRFPFHLSRITYGENGFKYEHIGAYPTEQMAEWKYIKLEEDI